MNALLTTWRPWIAARARGMVGENEQLRDELTQRGLITLWQLGTRFVATHAGKLVRTIVKRRMMNQLEAEIRGIQRNGERLLPFI